YVDSPTPIEMWGRNAPATTVSKADVLFVSHDLSWSGAPLILFQIAKWCKESGFFVTAMSPKDGPLREKFREAGIPLVVDPLVVTPDTRSSQVYQPFSDRPVRVLSYGIPDPSAKVQPAPRSETKPIEFLLLGTIENRKGQQLLLEALRKLSDDVLQKTRFRIV